MGETSQMTSGTLSVFAYLHFGHTKGRDAVVGEPREEHRDRETGKPGRRACRKAPQLEELHRRRQANLVAEPLRRQLQRHEHVIRDLENDFSHDPAWDHCTPSPGGPSSGPRGLRGLSMTEAARMVEEEIRASEG